ncbi:MAG: hypothetical protein V2A79_04295, partial [Planctomycetota bacterium]
MLRRPPNGDPFLSEMVSQINAELVRKEPLIIGVVYTGTDLVVRFRAPYGVGWVQCQVQSSAVGGGGMTYDPATYVSTALVDCRADRLQDQTIAVTAGLRYAVFLVPVQYDGAVPPTKVMYDGEGGRPDAMASVTTWVGLPTAHNLLSASHGDSTAAACVRGDIITGQGASPLWTRLAKGTEAYYLRSGATDVAWAALAAADLTGTALPAGIVTSSLTAVGALNAGSITSGFGAIDIGADALTCGSATVATNVSITESAIGVLNAGGNTVLANRYSNTAGACGTLALGHARGTLASPAAVAVNDVLFIFRGRGHDGTNWITGTEIRGLAREAWTG